MIYLSLTIAMILFAIAGYRAGNSTYISRYNPVVTNVIAGFAVAFMLLSLLSSFLEKCG